MAKINTCMIFKLMISEVLLICFQIVKSLKSFKHSAYLARSINVNKNIKLQIGSGKNAFGGRGVNTNINQLNVWKIYFKEEKITNILAENVWVHLTLYDSRKAIQLCYKYLKKWGRLRIAVPDGNFPNTDYIEYVKPGGHGVGSDDHKMLYNYKIISQKLEKVGFKVVPLEYWDDKGGFHYIEWSEDHGKIFRSKKYDSRNAIGV